MMKFSFPEMAGILQQVGDVIPFRQRSIEPGMGLTEGARAYPGGAEVRNIDRAGKPETVYQQPSQYYNADEMELRGLLGRALGKGDAFQKAPPAGTPEWNLSYKKLYGTPEQAQWLDTPDGKYYSAQYTQQFAGKTGKDVPDFGQWLLNSLPKE